MVQITKETITLAQKKWVQSLIAIGRASSHSEDYVVLAEELIKDLYGYHIGDGTVLFKPTKAAQIPFRSTFESALSYFIGGNANFPEDKGFALTPWVSVEINNHNFYFHNDIAMVMGYFILTSASHDVVKVEYTFGYVNDEDDQLKIVLHHSSLPYSIDS